jgi:hypothetical protein
VYRSVNRWTSYISRVASKHGRSRRKWEFRRDNVQDIALIDLTGCSALLNSTEIAIHAPLQSLVSVSAISVEIRFTMQMLVNSDVSDYSSHRLLLVSNVVQ